MIWTIAINLCICGSIHMHGKSQCRSARVKRCDFDKYLRGSGIDIGAGNDPLRVLEGSVRGWDVAEGDAQLMPGVADGAYDFVYSSHCLEHTREVPEALWNWVRIIKPGGHLYVVVPDYILYEKMSWPSRFNSDHKQSFSATITRAAVVRPSHWHMDQDLLPLLGRLGVDVVSLRRGVVGVQLQCRPVRSDAAGRRGADLLHRAEALTRFEIRRTAGPRCGPYMRAFQQELPR